MAILTLISIVFLASSSWNTLVLFLNNLFIIFNLLFGFLDFSLFLSMVLSVVGLVCSRVTLEAVFNKVNLVFVTRVHLRS